MIAQDPAFTELDKRMLCEVMGFEVVETPTAFNLIDQFTFVYAPHMVAELYCQALVKQPPLTFGNNLDHFAVFSRNT